MPYERIARIIQCSQSAEEEWDISIPDEAPDTPLELAAWLKDPANTFKWNYENLIVSDFGEVTEISCLDCDPKPEEETPEWWEKVYKIIKKMDPDLIQRMKEEYGND